MKTRKQLPQWLIAALFPAVLFYYELLFRAFTVGGSPKFGTVVMLLFCLSYAGVAWLLATLSKRKGVNFGVTLAYLLITAVVFLVEYFVYRKFQILYDLNTTLGGAGDALGDYQEDIFAMIFSAKGLWCIFLFLLPGILFAIFGWRYAAPQKLKARPRIAAFLAALALYGLGWLGISKSPSLSLMTGKEYDFQAVVSQLGLVTGLGMDAKEYFASGSGDGSFEATPTMPQLSAPAETTAPAQTADPSADTPPQTTPEPTQPPVVYTPNQVALDFSKPTKSGTVKKLNAYVQTLTPSMKNEFTGLFQGKNLIFITAEAFTAEVIHPELTPTLYRLANKGIQFLDYYQPSGAGTTGGEYQNVFGMLPSAAGMSFKKTYRQSNYYTMGNQLNRLGYYGAAFHNNDYTYYDRHLTHNNLGYSAGFMGYGNGMEEYVQDLWPQSDLEMLQGTLPTYIGQQPFNIYYMSVSGHSRYSRGSNAMTAKNWSRVTHLDCSTTLKGYFAANLELEDALTYLVAELEKAGIADDTVIVIASDHFPYGLDDGGRIGNMPYLSELYGYKVTNRFQRDHSRLIIWSGCLEDMEPIIVDSPTSSLDILPTLSNLFGTEFDSRLMVGRDVFSDAPALVFNSNYEWKTDYGTYYGGSFHPADASVQLPEGYVDAVKAIVRNKVLFCEWVLDTDYYGYLFAQTE